MTTPETDTDMCEGCGDLFAEDDLDERGYCADCGEAVAGAAEDDEECE
jgi:rRNA maturation endonuclease Nob1